MDGGDRQRPGADQSRRQHMEQLGRGQTRHAGLGLRLGQDRPGRQRHPGAGQGSHGGVAQQPHHHRPRGPFAGLAQRNSGDHPAKHRPRALQRPNPAQPPLPGADALPGRRRQGNHLLGRRLDGRGQRQRQRGHRLGIALGRRRRRRRLDRHDRRGFGCPRFRRLGGTDDGGAPRTPGPPATASAPGTARTGNPCRHGAARRLGRQCCSRRCRRGQRSGTGQRRWQ